MSTLVSTRPGLGGLADYVARPVVGKDVVQHRHGFIDLSSWVATSTLVSCEKLKISGTSGTVYRGPIPSRVDGCLKYLPAGPIIPGWMIVSPIVIEIEKDDDGEFVVTDRFSTAYGNAASESEAISDYCLSLIDYYEILEGEFSKSIPAAIALMKLLAYVNRAKT